jgi:formylglycine-generating enzyme required for sulfatase activity
MKRNHIFYLLLCCSLLLLTACSDSTEAKKTLPDTLFDPPGMIYLTTQFVTITCEIEEVVIRYTTDGSNPSESSPEYTEPVEIAHSTILKARAYHEDWNPSDVAAARYTIPEMVFLPGGTINIGDTRGEGIEDELPVHQVTISDFYLGKYPVTQLEWIDVMDNNPSALSGRPEHPVESINWYATLVYCNKRSIKEGLTPVYTIDGSTNPDDWGEIPTSTSASWSAVIAAWQADGYRLATESEWEFAARAGTNNPDYLYSGSDFADDVAWHSGNAGGSTQPVGSKNPNAFGLFDMSGNVYEWVWDWRDLYTGEDKINPTGPETGTMKVERGGSYTQLSSRARVSHRTHTLPRNGNHHRGLRVVRIAP